MRYLFLVLILFSSVQVFSRLNDVDRAFIQHDNLLENPSFVHGKAGWSVSTGSFSITGSGRDANATWDAGASGETLCSDLVTVPARLDRNNGYWSISMQSGTASTFKAYAYDGTNVLGAEVDVTSSNGSFPVVTSGNFIFPSSGSIQLCIESQADEPSVGIYNAYLGDAANLTDTTPQDVFSAKVADGSSTTTVSDENANWIDGNCSNGSSGSYTCTFVSGIFSVAPNCVANADVATNGYDCTANDETASNVDIYCSTAGGGGIDMDFKLSCQAQGVDTVKALKADQSAMSWSGYFDSTCAWALASATFVDFTADASCALVEKTNQNFGTVAAAGSVKPSITFTPKKAGIKYRITAQAEASNNANASSWSFRLYDGTSTLSTRDKFQVTSGTPHLIDIIGYYTSTDVSPVTITLQGNSGSGGTTNTIRTGVTEVVSFGIEAITSPNPAPLIKNSVVTTADSVYGMESAFITNTGTPVVTTESGDWISSLTDNGTGDTTINFTTGTFSAAPVCVCIVGHSAGGQDCGQLETTAPTSSQFRVITTSSGGGAVDHDFYIHCHGPR